jgi:predicted enzyme related to lactoylglutathione lyase
MESVERGEKEKREKVEDDIFLFCCYEHSSLSSLLARMLSRLSRIVLMVRPGDGLLKATEFYQQGLGLTVVRATEEWAEMVDASNLAISLHVANQGESQVATGYSPILQFQTTDMDRTIAKCVQLGGHLDGPIQYPAHGKVAALRTPEGHMIGLYEPAE